MLKLEEEVVSHTVPSNIPIMSSPADANDTKTCKEDCGSACSDIGGVVASTPDVSDRDIEGEHEYTIIQELYELDKENTISVRKLHDVLETQIQMPKAVCCDDWLVLDFSIGDLVS